MLVPSPTSGTAGTSGKYKCPNHPLLCDSFSFSCVGKYCGSPETLKQCSESPWEQYWNLIIGVATDRLFTPTEPRELPAYIPGAELVSIESSDEHDGFLLEFEQINRHVLRFLRREFLRIYANAEHESKLHARSFNVKKTCVFGEPEADFVYR
jgi:hypothetical protein